MSHEFNKRKRSKQRLGLSFALVILLAIAFAVCLAWAVSVLRSNSLEPNQVLHVMKRMTGEQQVVLKPSPHGHFIVPGKINGKRVKFLIDTGASNVAIPATLAFDLGIREGRAGEVETANGRTDVFHARLRTLSIGTIKLRNIRATILSSGHEEHVLLGMSALKQLDFCQRNGVMTLTQHPQ